MSDDRLGEFLAGVPGFFPVSGAREPDRRLGAGGTITARVVVARLASALLLAAVAAVGALVALAVRTDVADVPRAVGATAMFAVIYLGIGAVVGDRAMTAGMAFEAINHGGDARPDMLVILNDNAMSISENDGAMVNYLSALLSGKLYNKLLEGGKRVLPHRPTAL